MRNNYYIYNNYAVTDEQAICIIGDIGHVISTNDSYVLTTHLMNGSNQGCYILHVNNNCLNVFLAHHHYCTFAPYIYSYLCMYIVDSL